MSCIWYYSRHVEGTWDNSSGEVDITTTTDECYLRTEVQLEATIIITGTYIVNTDVDVDTESVSVNTSSSVDMNLVVQSAEDTVIKVTDGSDVSEGTYKATYEGTYFPDTQKLDGTITSESNFTGAITDISLDGLVKIWESVFNSD